MTNIKKIVILFISIVGFILSFNNRYNSIINEFEGTAKSKEALLNEYIKLSSNFIDLMTAYGNNCLIQGKMNDSELYNILRYDAKSDSYSLDTAAGIKYKDITGSLTGAGIIPRSGIDRTEINLAFRYYKFFSVQYNELPDIAWIYYTSENNFISMYPWISPKNFAFSKELKNVEFYKCANPENDPLRKKVWTPVYLDQAGKGLMVTLSSPIYYNDNFKGVLSLDLTNAKLSEILNSKYDSFLIDDKDSVIATSFDVKFQKEIIKLNNLIDSSQDEIELIKKLDTNKAVICGKYYLYAVRFTDAPWRMFFRIPIWVVICESLLLSLPILIICILLILTIDEAERRKKTEIMLTNSLEELKSYHELLENAAKYDFLTSTVNRRGFKEILSRDAGENSAFLILCDIDHFKQLNDTYGHAAGDKVLIQVADIIQKCTRNNDVVCRWGGEEFVIMLMNRTSQEADAAAESIRKEIENSVIYWENSIEIKTTMTFGVAKYNYNESIEDNVSKADKAMYFGKNNGRNQVINYWGLK